MVLESSKGGILTNCRFYKIFDNFLHFYNKIWPNFYIYKILEKSFYLQLDVLKFYNIFSNFWKNAFYIEKSSNSTSTTALKIYNSTTFLSQNSTFYNFFLWKFYIYKHPKFLQFYNIFWAIFYISTMNFWAKSTIYNNPPPPPRHRPG